MGCLWSHASSGEGVAKAGSNSVSPPFPAQVGTHTHTQARDPLSAGGKGWAPSNMERAPGG